MNYQHMINRVLGLYKIANFITPAKKQISTLFILAVTIVLSGCQITLPFAETETVEVTNAEKIETVSYSKYYIWLKSLTNAEILEEENKQKSIIAASPNENNIAAQSKLILMYSLSTAGLHQPYKAKRLLNELLILSHNMETENLAFTMLLRDQLNTQLRLLEKQNATNKDCNEQLDEHHLLIEQLQNQVNQVNQQLILLKKIDLNINERG